MKVRQIIWALVLTELVSSASAQEKYEPSRDSLRQHENPPSVDLIGAASAKDHHVSPQDTSKISEVKAGDTVWFAEGRYAKPVILQGLEGTADNPITLAAAPGERVVLDGTDELPNDWMLVTPDSAEGKLIQPAQWERIQGKVYCLKLDEPVHALVDNDRLMSDAR